jgi:hypothetical protein
VDSPSTPSAEDTLELRLARWRAAGVASDRRQHQRAVVVGILLFCGFVVAFAVVLYVG